MPENSVDGYTPPAAQSAIFRPFAQRLWPVELKNFGTTTPRASISGMPSRAVREFQVPVEEGRDFAHGSEVRPEHRKRTRRQAAAPLRRALRQDARGAPYLHTSRAATSSDLSQLVINDIMADHDSPTFYPVRDSWK